MVYYMQFTHCMFNQSAINNHAVINMQCPPYNVMFGSNLGAGGASWGIWTARGASAPSETWAAKEVNYDQAESGGLSC